MLKNSILLTHLTTVLTCKGLGPSGPLLLSTFTGPPRPRGGTGGMPSAPAPLHRTWGVWALFDFLLRAAGLLSSMVLLHACTDMGSVCRPLPEALHRVTNGLTAANISNCAVCQCMPDLAAVLAWVGLLASVHSLVRCEVVLLCEALRR